MNSIKSLFTVVMLTATLFVAGAAQANYNWDNGDRFVGTNAAGGGCGWGTLYYASGGKFYGSFHANSCRQRTGTFTWSDGTTYSGGWTLSGNKKKGITKFTSGNTFNGTYHSNGKMLNGFFTWANGSTYRGSWTSTGYKYRGTSTYDNGSFTGTYFTDNSPKSGTYTWTSGTVYVGSWGTDGAKTGTYTWADGTKSTYTNGIRNVGWRDGSDPHDWSNIVKNDTYTRLAMDYAERIYPGITKIVEFKAGYFDSEVCGCGGYAQMAVINGKKKFRIVLTESWFTNTYSTKWGYIPDAYQSVAHEIAHILNYLENGWDSDDHGPRFKHWYQEVIPAHLAWKEEGYDYPEGEPNYDKDVDYYRMP